MRWMAILLAMSTTAAAEGFTNCSVMQITVNGQTVVKTVCCNSQGLCY